jgi:hypothetical protein
VRATEKTLDVSVGTDASPATRTRRETDFYEMRLNSDYVPRGFHLSAGPIQGHEFGLKLSANDRDALIAFLKTL